MNGVWVIAMMMFWIGPPTSPPTGAWPGAELSPDAAAAPTEVAQDPQVLTHCIYEVTKVKIKSGRCGAVCTRCPYQVGQRLCGPASCSSLDSCQSRVTWFEGCGDGFSACVVKARAVSCTECAPDC